ncbi:TPA: hypothetical protein ACJ9A9_000638 [Streptococcus pneumoniae]|jgi:hypothetical protein|uniref:hypothetical protein n=1 Tax=Streptococcus oralis TaxID=1303 RepID=UPI001BBC8285|nr:Uncharacterised protein [Streptococcus pneumoniae]
MANIKQNRIEIRGLTDDEINYLKSLAKKNNAKSFNDFLLSICREKIEYGKFNRAQDLYVAHLENMKLASDHVLEQMKKQTRILSEFEEKMDRYGGHISRWLEYEGEVESDD